MGKEHTYTSTVAYTFKTLHMDSAGSGYAEYPEASTTERTAYKWSNDNRVYTELSTTLEMDDGFMIFFLGESPSLDNS
jgi:hypothetical protein